MSSEQEFLKLADEIRAAYEPLTAEPIAEAMRRRLEVAQEIGKSWSGSNLGYQANVYYENFTKPPPGMHFSSEWGFKQLHTIVTTSGDWREHDRDHVVRALVEKAGGVDLTETLATCETVWGKLSDARDLALAIFERCAASADKYLSKQHTILEETNHRTVRQLAHLALPQNGWTRDTLAHSQGLRTAPHQDVIFEVLAIQSVIDAGKTLEGACRKASDHIGRSPQASREERIGKQVFIGHGRAPAWRELKDFISDRLGLPPDEFNRVPVAGVTNTARLSQMLDDATMALIVLTAEDEQKDGSMNARMNVIHEVGLFQGRLGVTKAIVLIEEGCEKFSNIEGLGQILFPAGKISACFEEVRKVLEREGVLE